MEHETASSSASLCPLGLGTTDHAVPSQCAASESSKPEAVEYPPTAKQSTALTHDTPSRATQVAPVGVGLGTTDQLVPSHCWTSVAEEELPTAKQLVALVHDTAFSVVPVGLGLGTSDHVVPFQCSIVSPGNEPSSEVLIPTAKQFVGLEHDTPVSGMLNASNGLALGEIVHADGLAAAGGTGAVAVDPATSAAATATLTNPPALRRIPPPAPCPHGRAVATQGQRPIAPGHRHDA